MSTTDHGDLLAASDTALDAVVARIESLASAELGETVSLVSLWAPSELGGSPTVALVRADGRRVSSGPALSATQRAFHAVLAGRPDIALAIAERMTGGYGH